MKLACLLICITLTSAVTAKKPRYTHYDSDRENESDSFEEEIYHRQLEVNGNLKKYFALEAALTDPDHNLICSPISALLPLGKLALGASGETLDELFRAIGVTEKSKLKITLKKFIEDLKHLPGVKLNVVSRIYISDRVSINKDFSRDSKKIFTSAVKKVDFKSPKHTADQINKWVSRQTNRMIPTIIRPDEISPSSSMILVNAIHFVGTWEYKFRTAVPGNFHSSFGIRKAPMMSLNEVLYYKKSEVLKAEIVELPYRGGNASFVIVLPRAKDGLQSLLRQLKLAPELLSTAMETMSRKAVNVIMPKFKIETELDLKVLYEKIGLQNMFNTHNSGLSGIVKKKTVYVSKAIQKAVIEVNEKGTKAAAASGLDVVVVSQLMTNVKFIADHPFLFYVKTNNQHLFAVKYLVKMAAVPRYTVNVDHPFLFYIKVQSQQLFSGVYYVPITSAVEENIST